MNFESFLNFVDLDTLAKNNPDIFPTFAELMEFLNSHGFILENGSIDFDAWRDYDKELFNMERELEEFKGGKK